MTISSLDLLVIAFGLFLSILHLSSHKISEVLEKMHVHLMSLSGGLFISLIFLVYLPEVLHSADNEMVFPLMLAGFASFHLIEKLVYKKVPDRKTQLKEIKGLHVLGFTIDQFFLGFLIGATIEMAFELGFLVLFPVVINIVVASIIIDRLHDSEIPNYFRYLITAAPFAGALLSVAFERQGNLETYALSFILGFILYIVSREIIPMRKEGSPFYFVLGMIVTFIFWLGL